MLIQAYSETRKIMKLTVAALFLVSIAGCSNRDLYSAIQESYQQECLKLADSQQQECINRHNETYGEYTRKRTEKPEDSY